MKMRILKEQNIIPRNLIISQAFAAAMRGVSI